MLLPSLSPTSPTAAQGKSFAWQPSTGLQGPLLAASTTFSERSLDERWAMAEATTVQLPDGRKLAYTIRGDSSRPNVIVWLHGIVSSRFECSGTQEAVLAEQSAYIIGFDRPGYGASSPHRGRTYRSFVQDLKFALGTLGVGACFVVGVSGGGPYALAFAAFEPHTVLGVLLVSPAGYPGKEFLTSQERREALQHLPPARRRLLKLLLHPGVVTALCKLSETWLGGRLLYEWILKPLSLNSLNAMAEVDRRCLLEGHPEYLALVRPESMRQRTATGFCQDLALYARQPWSFQPKDLPSSTTRNIHLWHGTNDMQVPVAQSRAYKRMMPDASLDIVEGGGHFAYYIGDPDCQRRALSAMIGQAKL